MEQRAIRVLVVDDQVIVREGICLLLGQVDGPCGGLYGAGEVTGGGVGGG